MFTRPGVVCSIVASRMALDLQTFSVLTVTHGCEIISVGEKQICEDSPFA